MTVATDRDRLMVTLPKEMADKLRAQAEKENRTISNMIATIIQEHYRPRE